MCTVDYKCILGRCVFSHVGHLSLLGFDKMSEAVHETGTNPTKKAEQERKMSQSIYAPMLCVLSCVSLAGKAKLSLEVKIEKRVSYCKP